MENGQKLQKIEEIEQWAKTCLEIVTSRPSAANQEFHVKSAYQDILWLVLVAKDSSGFI